MKTRPQGDLLLTDRSAGTVRIEVDVRKIRQPVDRETLTHGSNAEYRNGVLLYAATMPAIEHR